MLDWLKTGVGVWAAPGEQFSTLWRRIEFESALAETQGFRLVPGLAKRVYDPPLKFGELRRGQLKER